MNSLFAHLDKDVFTVFSGSNRWVYAEVVSALYRRFFGADVIFPRQPEVVNAIYEVLAANQALWTDEDEVLTFDDIRTDRRRLRRRSRRTGSDRDAATDKALARARHIYVRLVNTGWLEEEHQGMRVLVDMPHGPMLLAGFLVQLREDLSTHYGGLLVQIRQAVDSCKTTPQQNGLGLNKAARDAETFGRSLRAVRSALKEVERDMVQADSLQGRLRALMEDFVGKLFLKDFKELLTSSHPAAHQGEIRQSLAALENDPETQDDIAKAYEGGLAQTPGEAREQVARDIEGLRLSLERIAALFDSINDFRTRLEGKLRNTIRYAGADRDNLAARTKPLIEKMNQLMERSPRAEEMDAPGLLYRRTRAYSRDLHAAPPRSRSPVQDTEVLIPERDPLFAIRRDLERAYLAKVNVRPEAAARYLERHVPPHVEKEARYLAVDTLDDALILIAIRAAVWGEGDDVLARRLRDHFDFAPDEGDDVVDNRYFRCANFRVTRKTDHVTIVPAE